MFKIERFLDSYEYVDFNSDGRVRRDFLAWKNSEVFIPVQVNTTDLVSGLIRVFRRKSTMVLEIIEKKFPMGFKLSWFVKRILFSLSLRVIQWKLS